MENLEKNNWLRAGASLSELIVTMAVTSILAAALFTGAAYAHKSFKASEYYVSSQSQQLLLLDYMALDLRRALTVTTTSTTLSLTIPDYYDESGEPRVPRISLGTANYGDVNNPVPVRYYQQGDAIFREVDGVATAIASDVATVSFAVQDLGQVVQTSVTFLPRYRWSSPASTGRVATSVSSSTLLRNTRRN